MKEAHRPSLRRAIRNSTIILSFATGCGPIEARSPVEVFASPTTPITETLDGGLLPAESVSPTETQIPTLEPTPTQEIAKPTEPNGLRPVNAASEILENGTWVVRNRAGEITATWNAQKSEWDYSVENINVAYTFVGLEVDRSIIEPFLGPLPPDDPSTHFKNLETGEPTPYGIGPEVETETVGLGGRRKIPTTEFFARFRGIAPFDSYDSVLILDVPYSIDKSIIFTIRTNNSAFYIGYSPLDNMVLTPGFELFVDTDDHLHTANQSLVGKQVMIRIQTDVSVGITGSAHDVFVKSDRIAEAFLGYFRDPSTSPPTFVIGEDYTQNIKASPLIIPESQLP